MTTDLAVRPMSPFEPTTLAEAMTYAKMLSTSGLMPKHLVGKPADIMLIMAKGRELGLSTMQSIGGISVIQGKPVLEAATMTGLVLSHPEVCEWFTLTESTEAVATYRTKRRGAEPVEMSFTIDEAKRAGLTGKDNWRSYPAAMLRARATAALARAVYPDLVAGIYVTGEIPGDDHERRDVAPATSAPPVAGVSVVSPTIAVSQEMLVASAGVDSNPFHDAEFSPIETQRLDRLAEFKAAVFPKGSAVAGQFLESADVAALTRYRDKLKAVIAERPTPPNLASLAAAEHWIAEKSKDYTAEEIAAAQVTKP